MTTPARSARVFTPVLRRRWLIAAAIAAVALAFLVPQLWLVSLSLKDRGDVFAYPPQWIPDSPSLVNYVFPLTATQVPWYLWNSVFRSVA